MPFAFILELITYFPESQVLNVTIYGFVCKNILVCIFLRIFTVFKDPPQRANRPNKEKEKLKTSALREKTHPIEMAKALAYLYQKRELIFSPLKPFLFCPVLPYTQLHKAQSYLPKKKILLVTISPLFYPWLGRKSRWQLLARGVLLCSVFLLSWVRINN